MIDKDKEVKKLYRDAAYFHLLNQECTKIKAKIWVRRLCN
jgi:hypothetical protein